MTVEESVGEVYGGDHDDEQQHRIAVADVEAFSDDRRCRSRRFYSPGRFSPTNPAMT
ncbi:MAG: hypothetical protein ABI706_10905 [Ilumatobacteraceae bacterium]